MNIITKNQQTSRILLLVFTILSQSCISLSQIEYLQQPANSNKTEYNIPQSEYMIRERYPLQINIYSIYEATAENVKNIFEVKQYYVDRDGNIDMPLLGLVHVKNKTIEEIEELLKSELDKYFDVTKLYVDVNVSGTFSIVGEVERSGVYPVNNVSKDNIIEAITKAGDMTIFADRKHVQILREENGKYKTYVIDLTSASIIESPFFYVQPQDIIYVRSLPQKIHGLGTDTFSTVNQLVGTIGGISGLIATIIILSR